MFLVLLATPLICPAESLIPELFNLPIPGCTVEESLKWKENIYISFSTSISYPKAAQMRGWEGSGLASLDVSPNGLASESKLVKSTGYKMLDMAVLSGLAKMIQVPKAFPELECATDLRKPISIALPFTFSLRQPTEFDIRKFNKP